ncbi:MAG: ATP-binding protein [Fimbriimonas sp.]
MAVAVAVALIVSILRSLVKRVLARVRLNWARGKGVDKDNHLQLFGQAAALVALATLVRVPFEPLLDYQAPFGLYFPVIAYISWRGGFWPGFFALALGILVSSYLYLEPRMSLVVAGAGNRGSVILFMMSGLSICAIGEANWRTRKQKKEVQERLRESNANLEARINERTLELVKKNEELEGFSYAISHDLRAPIRAIVGRARIVEEEEAQKLSEDGRGHLSRLVKAGLHLSAVVDDLLSYARTGQRIAEVSRVDLSQLFRTVYDEVCADHRCSAKITVQEGLSAICDPLLMHLVFRNLVENSFKYARPDVPLEIELGAEDDREGMVYFIRDNGIGIDMAYADKLFRPFQRLHNIAEIPGTGIGLANVKRAIAAQGGRVWADSAPGRGATIRFTLAGGESPAQRAAEMERARTS